MRNIKLLIVLLALLFSLQSVRAEGLYLGFGIGAGDAKVDGGFFPDLTLNDDTDGIFIRELMLGYELVNNVSLEASISDSGSASGTDLSDLRFAVKYMFPSSSKSSFYAKSGVDFWKLESTRSMNGTMVGSTRIAEQSGEDLFLQFGLRYEFNQTFALDLSYDFSRPKYGKNTSGRLSLHWYPNN